MNTNNTITKGFNFVLFLYLFTDSVIKYFFDYDADKKVPWDNVYEWSPLFAMIVSILILLLLIIWSAFLIKIFWNKFISDLLKVRAITFNESMAISLIIAILTR